MNVRSCIATPPRGRGLPSRCSQRRPAPDYALRRRAVPYGLESPAHDGRTRRRGSGLRGVHRLCAVWQARHVRGAAVPGVRRRPAQRHRAVQARRDGPGAHLPGRLDPLLVYLVLLGRGAFAEVGKGPSSWPLWVAAFIGAFIYFWRCEAVWGQTLGKRLCDLRVVRRDGAKLGTGGAFVRNLLRIVDWLPFFYVLGAA